MAEAIEKATGVDAKLIRGSGGIFDVTLDGKLIYSKHETGRFPSHQEILNQLPKG